MRRLSPSTRADLFALLAVVTALVATWQAWRGNVLGAVIAALNGITVALVALGYRIYAQDLTRYMLARGGLIHGPRDTDSIPAVLTADQAVRMPVPPWKDQP
jgi:hypothetical protein